MSTYSKSGRVQPDAVDGELVLVRDDKPCAFTLSDSGAVLWQALDHFERPEDLELLLLEARSGLTPDEAAEIVRAFLDSLVKYGLATRKRRVRKVADLTFEPVDDELIVLSRDTRKVHLLNEFGALLWEALDQFGSSEELESLLAEAWPDKSRTEIEAVVRDFLDGLVDLGLVEEIKTRGAT